MSSKYQIIYADPPWGGNNKGRGRGKVEFYKTMDTEDICKLPIAELADTNCALFLWTVWPYIFDAEKVIKAWGFTYKTLAFIWVKRNVNQMGWFWGQGSWTRSNSEPCLLAVKGKMECQAHDVLSVIDTPVQGHSRKPDEVVRPCILRLVGDLPRIELFARRKVDGWDSWGDQIDTDISLDDIARVQHFPFMDEIPIVDKDQAKEESSLGWLKP